MPDEDKRRLFQETQRHVPVPVESVEKDYWVCFALRELLLIEPWGRSLTFKGGTSLSKAWRLVERLSEDIDIVVSRGELGFAGENSPERARSNKQQKSRVEEISKKCLAVTRGELLPSLRRRLEHILPSGQAWDVRLDAAGESILFDYPTVTGTPQYIPKTVKIELGARSDVDPSERRTVVPFVTEYFPQATGPGGFAVPSVAPTRTLLEKAFLIHEEHVRNRPVKARLARHFYDLWCLAKRGVGAQAIGDEELFRRVAGHRSIYFRVGNVDYKALTPGGLRLRPTTERMAEWKEDYEQTRASMVYGEAPEFAEVIRVVGAISGE